MPPRKESSSWKKRSQTERNRGESGKAGSCHKLPYRAFIALYAPRKAPAEVVNKLDEAVRRIVEDRIFLDKIREIDSLVTYENTATFDKTQIRYKADLQSFFKEQGMVK
jgi:tripartite-type tricarboxylate transporter receptor subunit TctC